MPTAQEVYSETVRRLPRPERLHLAALILNDLAQAESSAVDTSDAIDTSDAWTDRDQAEVTAFALGYAATLYPEGDDLVQPR